MIPLFEPGKENRRDLGWMESGWGGEVTKVRVKPQESTEDTMTKYYGGPLGWRGRGVVGGWR